MKAASVHVIRSDEAAPDPLTAVQAMFHQARRAIRRVRTRTRHLNTLLRTARRRAGLVQAQIEGAVVRHL